MLVMLILLVHVSYIRFSCPNKPKPTPIKQTQAPTATNTWLQTQNSNTHLIDVTCNYLSNECIWTMKHRVVIIQWGVFHDRGWYVFHDCLHLSLSLFSFSFSSWREEPTFTFQHMLNCSY